MSTRLLFLLTACLCLAAFVRAAADDTFTVSGRAVQTARHRFEVAESGLPSQIVVESDVRELPLELRAAGTEVSDAVLTAIGRGTRLRAPVRLVATVDGESIVAQVTAPGPVIRNVEGSATCDAAMAVGPYDVNIAARYDAAGAVTVRLVHERVRDAVATLALELELVGPVDMVCRPPDAPGPDAISLAGIDFSIGGEEGVVWDSLVGDAGRPGRVARLFVGSGDGGFTWRCDEETGWVHDDGQPTMVLECDELGRVTWRVLLVGVPVETRSKQSVEFVLRVHPTHARASGYRRTQWLDWPAAPDGGEVIPSTFPGFGPPGDDPVGRFRELRGGFCADIASAREDHIDLYRPSAVRMAAATWSSDTTRIRSNVRQVRPGDDPAFDRQVLGRSVLHDIGVAIQGVDQPVEFLRLVRALREFGYFEDADTEFIPYWRSGELVRFGEGFDPTSAFALTEESPAAHTYVSVYRRPFEAGGKKGYKALLVIMNERDEPVRERLYLLEPGKVLGPEGSTLTGLEIIQGYDFGTIPDDSDWRREKVGTYRWMFGATGLMDAEDGGYVTVSTSKGQTAAIYGPVYIPRHDYRILYGHWLPGAGGTSK